MVFMVLFASLNLNFQYMPDDLKKILLIDDDRFERELTMRELKRSGYTEVNGYSILELKTIEAAIKHMGFNETSKEFSNLPKGGIIVDNDTPSDGSFSRDGIVLIALLKGKEVPTVFVTGNSAITEEMAQESGGKHVQRLEKNAVSNHNKIPGLLKKSQEIIEGKSMQGGGGGKGYKSHGAFER
jgi:CheY-like chemotaxis protein